MVDQFVYGSDGWFVVFVGVIFVLDGWCCVVQIVDDYEVVEVLDELMVGVIVVILVFGWVGEGVEIGFLQVFGIGYEYFCGVLLDVGGEVGINVC